MQVENQPQTVTLALYETKLKSREYISTEQGRAICHNISSMFSASIKIDASLRNRKEFFQKCLQIPQCNGNSCNFQDLNLYKFKKNIHAEWKKKVNGSQFNFKICSGNSLNHPISHFSINFSWSSLFFGEKWNFEIFPQRTNHNSWILEHHTDLQLPHFEETLSDSFGDVRNFINVSLQVFFTLPK